MVDTAGEQESCRIRQLAVFLPNRLGALLRLHRALEAAAVRLRGLAIVDAADHAVARLVVDQPTLAAATLREQGYGFVESDLIGVAFQPEAGFRRALAAILVAEVNIHYGYSLLSPVNGRSVLALFVDDSRAAARLLSERGLELVDQEALR